MFLSILSGRSKIVSVIFICRQISRCEHWLNDPCLRIIFIVIVIVKIIAKYSGLDGKCIFQPTAVKSLGALNETACQFLKDLGRRISVQSGDEREGAFLFQTLLCSHATI